MIDINKKIAEIFRAKADLLERQGKVVYRIIALRRAAEALESHPEGVDVIYQRSWLRGLEKIPGVGNRLAHAIEKELLKLGVKRK
ncbi:hypothetical protein ACFL04_01710 [Patescibacteria group bacterium]